MGFIFVFGLFGIWRFRYPSYWRWLAIITVWMIVMNLLFYAGGTLEDPSGDGFITRQLRIATNDGVGMGIFAIVFIIGYWGLTLYWFSKMFKAGRAARENEFEEVEDQDRADLTGRKIGETIILITAFTAWIYLTIILPMQDAQAIVSEPPQASTTGTPGPDPIALQIAKVANQLNASVPQTLDEVTRLDSASTKGRVFIYHYTITRRDGSDEALAAFLEKNAVAKACKNPDMLADMRDYGITYRYSYSMPNQAKTVDVDATWDKCK